MEIYYTRLGETIGNIKSIIQGQTGGELIEEGFHQVSLLGKRLSEIKFDYIYCSDLNRTKQTLETILKELKFPPSEKNIFYVKSLREINVASLVGQPLEKEIKMRNNPLHPYRFNKTGENDENYYDVFLRISLFLDEIIKKILEKNIKVELIKKIMKKSIIKKKKFQLKRQIKIGKKVFIQIKKLMKKIKMKN